MKILDSRLLNEFRSRHTCEWCGMVSLTGCDPHHIFSKGMGGSQRLDLRINVVALDRACHDAVHACHITRDDLVSLVARREKTTVEAIVDEIHRLQRIHR